MKTNNSPWDYERPLVIIDLAMKYCPRDGGPVVSAPPDGAVRCLTCGGTEFVLLLQSEAAGFRSSLEDGDEIHH